MSCQAPEQPKMKYSVFTEKLKRICRSRGLRPHRLGEIGDAAEYPLFAVVLPHGRRPKRAVCFAAGVHGDEGSAPLATLEFIRQWRRSPLKNVRVVIFPCCNPWGFENAKRRTYCGRDLNRHFFDWPLKHEAKLLYRFLQWEELDLFVSLHENQTKEVAFIATYHPRREEGPIHQVIKAAQAKWFRIARSKLVWQREARHGTIFNIWDRSFEHRLYIDGVPDTVCVELPGHANCERQVQANVQVMKDVIEYYERGGRH